ncbi:uncharacterized protein EI90DRAFT_3118629 [Cantharellus anzutake]|uniref:uncharacterized protein n=1 Tax=Cantharellus anzutake TaxID=1750568 RepID=UPI0019069082|nr:uncharacterized protein EI90DRAFT_3118629 [Cantharellus anzutake]KAF8338202.1 hypothetical protein EI90DRAFT_3118629 [Cantharellus anzutake]
MENLDKILLLMSNNATVEFYHATAKEFIMEDPIGEEEDKVFFIDDRKGYFLGLRLLRLVNGVIQRNEVGIPTELPLGDRKKGDNFLAERLPDYIQYPFNWLFDHLDPWSLFSEESNELQREFERLLTRHSWQLLSGG